MMLKIDMCATACKQWFSGNSYRTACKQAVAHVILLEALNEIDWFSTPVCGRAQQQIVWSSTHGSARFPSI
jgi:hypothetical protein